MLVVVLYFISVSMNFIRKLVPLTRPVAISLVVVLYFISVSMNFIRKLVPLTRPVAISLVVVLYFISVSMNFIRKLVPLTRPVAIILATKNTYRRIWRSSIHTIFNSCIIFGSAKMRRL